MHLAKIAFEKYFMRKMKTGNSEPVYEKCVLGRFIVRLGRRPAVPRVWFRDERPRADVSGAVREATVAGATPDARAAPSVG